MRQRKSFATIKDVANTAGVSISTVSRALNNKDDVSPETSAKIHTVINELNYTSSLAARSMRSQRINVIGVIMPDVASSYCIEVLRGINQAITQSDYDLIIYTTGDIWRSGTADQERRYVALLNGSITDGMIVVAPVATHFSWYGILVSLWREVTMMWRLYPQKNLYMFRQRVSKKKEVQRRLKIVSLMFARFNPAV